jgi:hypothetical protein
MFHDRSLVPGEAVRLLALGSLMESDKPYADLALEIRFFTQRIVGPSLDLLGSSLTLLKIEGLAEALNPQASDYQSLLRITPAGTEHFMTLMGAQLRTPVNDVGRLILLLKIRFMPFLAPEMKEEQLDMLNDLVHTERARAHDLAQEYKNHPMAEWLMIDITQSDQRIAWLEAALDKISITT